MVSALLQQVSLPYHFSLWYIFFCSYSGHKPLPKFTDHIFITPSLCLIPFDSASTLLLTPCILLFLLLWSFSDTNIGSPESYLIFPVCRETVSSYLVSTYWSHIRFTHILFLLTVLRNPCMLYLRHRVMYDPWNVFSLMAIGRLTKADVGIQLQNI